MPKKYSHWDKTEIFVPDINLTMPKRTSANSLKAMSDDELLDALSGNDGSKGMVTMQYLQAISAELQRRAIEKASHPHWSVTPSFWLLVTSVLLSLTAIVLAALALPPVQKHVFQDQQVTQQSAPAANTPQHSPQQQPPPQKGQATTE